MKKNLYSSQKNRYSANGRVNNRENDENIHDKFITCMRQRCKDIIKSSRETLLLQLRQTQKEREKSLQNNIITNYDINNNTTENPKDIFTNIAENIATTIADTMLTTTDNLIEEKTINKISLNQIMQEILQDELYNEFYDDINLDDIAYQYSITLEKDNTMCYKQSISLQLAKSYGIQVLCPSCLQYHLMVDCMIIYCFCGLKISIPSTINIAPKDILYNIQLFCQEIYSQHQNLKLLYNCPYQIKCNSIIIDSNKDIPTLYFFCTNCKLQRIYHLISL